MHLIIPLLLIASQFATHVTIHTLDDGQAAGKLAAWDNDSPKLAGANGNVVPIENVLKLVVEPPLDPSATPLDTATHDIEIVLVDGSVLNVEQIQTNGEVAELTRAKSSQPAMRAPLSSIRSARMTQVDDEALTGDALAELQSQWREIVSQNLSADAIVIRKPGKTSLDYVEGVLGDITDQAVQFALDGQQLSVSRTKVYGLVFFRQNSASPRKVSNAVVQGTSFKVFAESVRWNNDSFLLSNSLLGDIVVPAAEVSLIDFSIGRLVYLSDLEPTQLNWTSPAGLASSAPLLGGFARDRGFFSSILEIEYPPASIAPEQTTSAGLPHVQQFSKGLAARANLTVAYQLPGTFSRFDATAAIAPHTKPGSSVELKFFGDGELLTRKILSTGDAPTEIDCDISGVAELSIVVQSKPLLAKEAINSLLSTGDVVHLGGARITQ